MTQRIVVTISIDIPNGARVTVNDAEPPLEDAPWPDAPAIAAPPPSRPLAQGPGECPIHKVPYTWKEAGVSKAGKPYDGFYKCGEKNPDGSYCKQRP